MPRQRGPLDHECSLFSGVGNLICNVAHLAEGFGDQIDLNRRF
jgi:hypothetical protein